MKSYINKLIFFNEYDCCFINKYHTITFLSTVQRDLMINDKRVDVKKALDKNEMARRGSSRGDRKSTRLNSSHSAKSRMPSSA